MALIYVANYGDGTASLTNATSAYNAASAGDTIVFPLAGSATWNSGLAVTKAVSFDGNGTTLTAGATFGGFFIYSGITTTNLVRITGFDFDCVNYTGGSPPRRALGFSSLDILNLRIDHNNFYFGYEAIDVGGCKGVIDNNVFRNTRKAISYTAGTEAQATASWVDLTAGTEDALFIEDNLFVDDADYGLNYTQEKIGTFNGGKLVIRYNDFDTDDLNVALTGTAVPIITHGSAAGGVANGYWQIGTGGRRGQSVVEIYNNTAHGPRIDVFCWLRGSTNLVHDNTVDTATNPPRIIAYEEEQYESSNWSPLRTAWPAEDQVHNSFFWNNVFRKNGVVNTSYFEVSASSLDYIQEGRDYWLHAPQSTGGHEYFTGANGASGSYPTDGNTYPTLGTMVFSSSGPNAHYPYTPYIYPHPLTRSQILARTAGLPGTSALLF